MDLLKKSFFYLFFLLHQNLYADSDNAYNCVAVETIKGEIFEFVFLSNPCMNLKGDTIIMTNDEKKVDFLMTDIRKVFFSSINTGTKRDDIVLKGQLNLKQDCIYLSHFMPGEQIAVYNLAGQQILRRTITSQGTLSIPFSDIPKGTVVIKSKNQAFKINRK